MYQVLVKPKIKYLKPYDFWQNQAFYFTKLLDFLEKTFKKQTKEIDFRGTVLLSKFRGDSKKIFNLS